MNGFSLWPERPFHPQNTNPSVGNSNQHSSAGENLKVLIIDDDIGTQETFERVLRFEGFLAMSAGTGEEGIELAKLVDFDLILVDLRLTDMSGIDVISRLHDVCSARFVLMSAFLTTRTAIDAMKVGAVDAVDKPLDIDMLLSVVRQTAHAPHARFVTSRLEQLRDRVIVSPRSVVERWVGYVIKVCEPAEEGGGGDFKTLEEWAHRVAVSYSTLCETCRLLGIRPLDGRDFARVLSALTVATVHACAPEVLLNVSDRRVLKALSVKAGVDLEERAEETSVQEFMTNQRFIPQRSEALRLIRTFASEWFSQRQMKRYKPG